MRELLFGQGNTIKVDASPAGLHEIPDVRMISIFRMR